MGKLSLGWKVIGKISQISYSLTPFFLLTLFLSWNIYNLEKINEFVSENSKIEVANAVIDYDSVDKFENQQPKVEEKDDLRKNLVTPVGDELKVAETTENTEVS